MGEETVSDKNRNKNIGDDAVFLGSYVTDALARSYIVLSKIIAKSNQKRISKEQLLQLMVRISSAEMDSAFAGVLENSAVQSVSSFFDSFYNAGDTIDGRNN